DRSTPHSAIGRRPLPTSTRPSPAASREQALSPRALRARGERQPRRGHRRLPRGAGATRQRRPRETRPRYRPRTPRLTRRSDRGRCEAITLKHFTTGGNRKFIPRGAAMTSGPQLTNSLVTARLSPDRANAIG